MLYRYLKLAPGEAIGSVLARYRGVGPGFDLLRILLAMVIFYGHTRWIAGSSGMAIDTVANLAATGAATGPGGLAAPAGAIHEWTGITRPLWLGLVPAFFALSGFLVTGSALRLRSTPTFLAHRALRIFPALAVETTLAALIIGPLLTILPVADYFAAPQFARYFGNFLGFVWYVLPGVFVSNPVAHIVNVNLWTLPSEFYCYLLMAAAMLTRLVYSRKATTALFIIVTAVLAITHAVTGISDPHGPYPVHVVVYYFFAGVMFYHWRDRVPASLGLFVAAAAITYASLFSPALTYVTPLFLVYTIVCFGLIPFPKFKLLASGDYSYGVYLYGFPIAQALVNLFPGVFIGEPWLLVPAALLLTLTFAAASWHGIEKHALATKRLLPARWFPQPTRSETRAVEERLATR